MLIKFSSDGMGSLPVYKYPKGRDSRLMSEILSGESKISLGNGNQQSTHFIDSLDRFERNYAKKDQIERMTSREHRLTVDQCRRQQHTFRQEASRVIDNRKLDRIAERQRQSQFIPSKRYFEPFDPISNRYKSSVFGEYQRKKDEQKDVDNLVRAHKIYTRTNPGYNIINGRTLDTIENMIPVSYHNKFVNQLSKYYEQFDIRLKQNQ